MHFYVCVMHLILLTYVRRMSYEALLLLPPFYRLKDWSLRSLTRLRLHSLVRAGPGIHSSVFNILYARVSSMVQVSSVAQSCLTLCNPMNHSAAGLPVHHQLLEFTQTHVH